MKTTRLRKIVILVGLTLLLTVSLGGIVSAAPAAVPALQAADDAGILILSVRANSPADKAGIVRGDIVLAVDGEEVDDAQALAAAILTLEMGDEVVLTVLHGDEIVDLPVILGERNGRTYLGVQPYVADEEDPVEADAETREEDDGEEGQDHDADVEDDVDGKEGEDHDIDVDEHADENEGEDHDAGEHAGAMQDLLDLLPAGLADAIVAEVVDESPAEKAGLVAGDRIVAVDGEELSEGADLAALIGAFEPGDEVTLDIVRSDAGADETTVVVVTLGAHPEDEERAFLGISYMPASMMIEEFGALPLAPHDLGREPGDEEKNEGLDKEQVIPEKLFGELFADMQFGAIIGEVVEDSPADEAGLVRGDMIVAVEDEVISPEADLADLIVGYEPGDEVTLEIRSWGDEAEETFKVVVTLGAHPEDEERAFLGVSYRPVPMMSGDMDGLPFMPRGFERTPQQDDEETERHHRHHHGEGNGEQCDEACPHHDDKDRDDEDDHHGNMMMPFHHFFGFDGFNPEDLSEEELEMLQEIFPFLFPEVEVEPESDGGM